MKSRITDVPNPISLVAQITVHVCSYSTLLANVSDIRLERLLKLLNSRPYRILMVGSLCNLIGILFLPRMLSQWRTIASAPASRALALSF